MHSKEVELSWTCCYLQVLANTLGALHEFAYSKRNLLTLKDDRVIPVVVRTLSITESAVLVNATRLLAVCAKERSCRRLVSIFSHVVLQAILAKVLRHAGAFWKIRLNQYFEIAFEMWSCTSKYNCYKNMLFVPYRSSLNIVGKMYVTGPNWNEFPSTDL